MDDVRKAKAEYEEDKYAKSAVESVRSRLWWWRQRAGEHEVELFPLTVDKFQLLGAFLEQVSGCVLDRGQEGAHQGGLPVDGSAARWMEGL